MAEENLERFRNEGHSAFVIGYTGETGKEIVKELARIKAFKKVVLIGRRKTATTEKLGPEFEEKVVDYDSLDQFKDAFAGCDIGFNCLGTTRKQSGREGFIKVDRDYVLKAAQIAKESGCRHFTHTSSGGSNRNSSFLYMRIKGEVEDGLKELQFNRLSIFRPGMLVCDREQPRFGEKCIYCFMCVCCCCLKKSAMISTETLAGVMVNNVVRQTEDKVEMFENKVIHDLSGS